MTTPVALFRNYNLKTLNTFGLEAYAQQLAFISSINELAYLHQLGAFDQPILVMGGGSNMLLLNDIERLILVNRIKGMEVVAEDATTVQVKWAGGEVWHQVVLQAIANGWGGIENLALIPGCIGAAPIQNIGAYGVELKDVFVSAEAYDLKSGQLVTFSHADCQFGYRESVFKQAAKDQYLITSVTLKLTKPGHHELHLGYGAITEVLQQKGVIEPTIKDVADAVIAIRQSKLPDPAVIGNAGSFFKNPEIPKVQFEALKESFPELPAYPAGEGKVKVPAGWLIEKAGLKGYKQGDYGVHAKQALVLVNYGKATGAEIANLAQHVIKMVNQMFGILLTPEVNHIS